MKKNEISSLYSYFKPTILGEIIQGMLEQYRYLTYAVYDFGYAIRIHKDNWNPETDSLQHLREDSPYWWFVAQFVAARLLVIRVVILTKKILSEIKKRGSKHNLSKSQHP